MGLAAVRRTARLCEPPLNRLTKEYCIMPTPKDPTPPAKKPTPPGGKGASPAKPAAGGKPPAAGGKPAPENAGDGKKGDGKKPAPAKKPAPKAAPVRHNQASRSGRRFGQVLIDLGFIDEDQLWDILEEAKNTAQPTGQVAVARGLINEDQLLTALAD